MTKNFLLSPQEGLQMEGFCGSLGIFSNHSMWMGFGRKSNGTAVCACYFSCLFFPLHYLKLIFRPSNQLNRNISSRNPVEDSVMLRNFTEMTPDHRYLWFGSVQLERTPALEIWFITTQVEKTPQWTDKPLWRRYLGVRYHSRCFHAVITVHSESLI